MVMNDRRELLLNLIEELELSVVPEDARKDLEKLNNEEVEILLARFQTFRDYKVEIEKALRKFNPEKYSVASEDYRKKVIRLRQDYLNKMEKVQAEADEKLEMIDQGALKDYDDLLKNYQPEVDKLVGDYKEVYSKLTKALPKD